jgi:hypothetical protein
MAGPRHDLGTAVKRFAWRRHARGGCGCLVMAFGVSTRVNMGVFVTREHVRHNKSGIAHRGRTGINH